MIDINQYMQFHKLQGKKVKLTLFILYLFNTPNPSTIAWTKLTKIKLHLSPTFLCFRPYNLRLESLDPAGAGAWPASSRNFTCWVWANIPHQQRVVPGACRDALGMGVVLILLNRTTLSPVF